MSDVSLRIDVASLRQLHKALRAADTELQKQLRKDLKGAADIVAGEARSKVPSRSGRAASSITTGSTNKGAYVAGGKNSVKYYGWLDFGSRTPIRGRGRSIGPWASTGKGPRGGRFIYPALSDKFAAVLDVVEQAVAKSIKEAGFD